MPASIAYKLAQLVTGPALNGDVVTVTGKFKDTAESDVTCSSEMREVGIAVSAPQAGAPGTPGVLAMPSTPPGAHLVGASSSGSQEGGLGAPMSKLKIRAPPLPKPRPEGTIAEMRRLVRLAGSSNIKAAAAAPHIVDKTKASCKLTARHLESMIDVLDAMEKRQ